MNTHSQKPIKDDAPAMVSGGSRLVAPGASAARIFSLGFGPRIMHDAPNEGGGNAPDPDLAKGVAAALAAKAAADKVAADAAQAEADRIAAEEAAKNKGPSDAEAKLLKENMERKATIKELQDKLKSYEGIDPEAARIAAAAKVEAEKAALAASGDFDRLKAMMADEHAKELTAAKTAAEAKDLALNAAQKTINELTIGSSFSSSTFINEELILTPAKARAVYGAHFEIEDGKTVGYDKPAGEATRTKLVDAAGNAMPFEAALKKLVEADPDRERLLKSKLATGAGSKTAGSKTPGDEANAGTGISRIAASLAAKSAAKK